ncbi:uncharacterized protein LOC104424873 [Eucalyptus grandis]|uniref:uncharacterized protein LOC104424873 n=1 Tax=Eucalyptus grandis TaxID=71139 RepID=UPI00192EACD8|nr:uncharacterized protein LOC104424873 [Eucalyptus grandis]
MIDESPKPKDADVASGHGTLSRNLQSDSPKIVNLAIGDPIQISANRPFLFTTFFPKWRSWSPSTTSRRRRPGSGTTAARASSSSWITSSSSSSSASSASSSTRWPVSDGPHPHSPPSLSLSLGPRLVTAAAMRERITHARLCLWLYLVHFEDVGFQYDLNLKLLGTGLMGLWRVRAYKSIVCFLWKNLIRLLCGKF